MERTVGLAIGPWLLSSDTTMPRPRKDSISRPSPFGKYAKSAPRLIGFGLLLVAVLLVVIGSMIA
jgi:hypothetical protein